MIKNSTNYKFLMTLFLITYSLNADMDYFQFALQSENATFDINDVKSCVQLAAQQDLEALQTVEIFRQKFQNPSMTTDQAIHILKHLSQGTMQWASLDEVKKYSNGLQADSWKYYSTPPSSAQVICQDACGNLQAKSYKLNARGWWQFDWENSNFITNCNGLVINGTNPCNHAQVANSCPDKVHRFTSYLFNPANQKVGLLKSDYLNNPQNYSSVTTYLLQLPV
jgi:hypothetical protein